MQDTIVINEENAEYGVEFCCYFPADNSQYTIMVWLEDEVVVED
jgi:hypothetical protein